MIATLAASVIAFMTTVPGLLLGAVERNPLAAVVLALGMAGVARYFLRKTA